MIPIPMARSARIAAVLVALATLLSFVAVSGVKAKDPGKPDAGGGTSGMTEIKAYHNDTSAPLRTLKAAPSDQRTQDRQQPVTAQLTREGRQATDRVVQRTALANMPQPLQSFDGIPFPGVACNCAPPSSATRRSTRG